MRQATSPSHTLPWWLALLIGAALLAAAILAFAPTSRGWFSDQKAWELTLQFLFVVVLGGGLALFYRNVESRRAEERKEQAEAHERMEAQQKVLEEFRKSLVQTYHSAKKLRRTLRASSLRADDGTGYCCQREVFERLMDQLEEVQLRTEALKAEVEARKDLFTPDRSSDLEANLRQAEKYLRGLLRQYEDKYRERHQLKPHDLVRLDDGLKIFIEGTTQSNGADELYFKPIYEARRHIVSIMESRTPVSAKRHAQKRSVAG